MYRGTDSHVYELTLSGDHWIASDLSGITGAPNAIGDQAAYVRSDGSPRINAVVYRATDNHIHELRLAKAPGPMAI